MEYHDFTIDIRSTEGGGFEAAVAQAPIRNYHRVHFAAPLSSDVLELLHDSFDRPGDEIGQEAAKIPSPRQIGEQVFTALFQGSLGELFLRCRDMSRDGNAGLRLRLRFRTDDPEAEHLAAIPWEWLWDPHCGDFLATDPYTPVVREIAASHRLSTLEGEPPLRILVVDAAPKTMKELGLKLELERMTEALAPLIAAGQVELLSCARATPEGMRDALLEGDVNVLHLMGHGGYDSGSGTGAVFFVDHEGKEDQVDGQKLAAFLKRLPSLRLVVLNSCKTARHKGRAAAPLSHGVATAVLEGTGVPAVLANQCSISDATAIAFSSTFYGRLAAGDDVDEALTEARLRLSQRTLEWATPILFLAAPSGKLFNVQAVPRKHAATVVNPRRQDSVIRLGVCCVESWRLDMQDRTDHLLDLTSYFEGRFIKDKAWWQEKVFPELRRFLTRFFQEHRPVLLDLAAHSSVAFAAGWILEPKSGLDVRVRQRTSDGELDWHPHDGSEPEGALWLERPDLKVHPGGRGLAAAVSVSQRNVAEQVRHFVRSAKLPVGRIVDAVIAPEPGVRSVHGGAHALRLAQTLLPRLQTRRPHERGGRLHLFCSAPNAVVFYLGQLASALGKVVLYEYPFRAENAYGRYQRSIELPPPDQAERERVPDGWE